MFLMLVIGLYCTPFFKTMPSFKSMKISMSKRIIFMFHTEKKNRNQKYFGQKFYLLGGQVVLFRRVEGGVTPI